MGPTTCKNIEPLPGNWGGTNGVYDCNYYENVSADYCAHAAISDACCFCGGGEELKCEDKGEGSGNESLDETHCNDNDGDDSYDQPTPAPTTEPAPTTCQNIEPLPGNWGGTNGMYDCNYYENRSAHYCAHRTISEACCFCGGGE